MSAMKLSLTSAERGLLLTALYTHATKCDRLAADEMGRRSSDATYEQNVHRVEVARSYRETAIAMRALRERVLACAGATILPVDAIALEIENTARWCHDHRAVSHDDDCAGGFVEFRLQVADDGTWAIHFGNASYDTDHRGVWGSGSLVWDGGEMPSRERCAELARELVNECVEQASTDDNYDHELVAG